ncbi:MAG: PhoH family protein [Candidatus Omnitrophica bacterium]|nr:PhoH family protein [Candidatus Omnitrophota bacterium]MDD5553473.1 PhoH family protein [Candidatus Omnitrophota bacterium]
MEKTIKLNTHEEAQALFGSHDEHIKSIEKEFKVKITLRGEHLKITGMATNIKKASGLIEYLLVSLRSGGGAIGRQDLFCLVENFSKGRPSGIEAPSQELRVTRALNQKTVGPKTKGQREYVEAIKNYDIVFGIGPAGTGKTYLAMACAVEALKKQEVRRIILTRPAIEAGESLGFLPGDIYEKISPYLRPLYDALYDMMDAERIEKYLETGIIEVAPLAYMRGRTLNDAFIVLDEAQNATREQMKMFLTRLGFDSKAVITGDMTQSDLPEGKPIGLLQSQEILKDIDGIKFIYFTGQDVVRHALVQRIIEAYDKATRGR